MKRLLFLLITTLLAILNGYVLCGAKDTLPEGKNGGGTIQSTGNETPAADEKNSTSVIQFYTWAGMLPRNFVDLQKQIVSVKHSDNLPSEVSSLEQEIKKLRLDFENIMASGNVQIMHVDALHAQSHHISNLVQKNSKLLTAAINDMSSWRSEWAEKKKQLESYAKEEQLQLVLAVEHKESLGKVINDALQLIDSHLTPALFWGKSVADLQVQLYIIDSDLKELDGEVRKASIKQTAPSILSLKFYKRINKDLFAEAYEDLAGFLAQHIKSGIQHKKLVAGSFLGILVLFIAVYISRRDLPSTSRWYPFSKCPGATALFASTTFIDMLTQLFVHVKLEQKWGQIFDAVTILALVRLLTYCMEKSHVRELLKRLSLFMAITMLLMAIGLPQLLVLFFVFYASIVALLVYVFEFKYKGSTRWRTVLRRTWGILPLFIVLTGVMGYDQFSINTFTVLLNSVSTCLVVWMFYMINMGLLEIVLRRMPFSLLRDNFKVIQKALGPIIGWLHIFYLIITLSVTWHLYSSIDESIASINSIGFHFGAFSLSLGFLISIIVALYGVLLFSRAIQAILLQEILPRYYVEKGTRISITRLVHYTVVTVGFFITLKVLGFDLKQITILGGALGVGIGFGLQAIVTNFASGLILLFERPIKVGDTIQVGTDMGEVKNLGLRSTIIKTFDNAEIVVPNSDLITGLVTNWTLTERRVRVKIPVGVAYGSDVAKVLEILKSCAREHPLVLGTPAPTALLLNFGASSLDFELRCWIPEFLEQITVLSELNQAIEDEFSANGIEIPFQQTDLHIKSVSPLSVSSRSESEVDA